MNRTPLAQTADLPHSILNALLQLLVPARDPT